MLCARFHYMYPSEVKKLFVIQICEQLMNFYLFNHYKSKNSYCKSEFFKKNLEICNTNLYNESK
ncbi:hypothetical protein J6TS2_38720 [Heyndrickxia sporothermodurans]|nr:hypothetical protein J6TS2_38720 [Heyndrickxia sporothermodurans]